MIIRDTDWPELDGQVVASHHLVATDDADGNLDVAIERDHPPALVCMPHTDDDDDQGETS